MLFVVSNMGFLHEQVAFVGFFVAPPHASSKLHTFKLTSGAIHLWNSIGKSMMQFSLAFFRDIYNFERFCKLALHLNCRDRQVDQCYITDIG